MRFRTRFPRLAAAGLAMLLVFGGSVAPAAAWSNNGNLYGSHDWILDQAFRLLTARGIDWSWVDRTVALVATDDPDTVEVAADPTRNIEHVYTGGGRRGGAVDRITEHYAAILRLYKEGRAAQLAGDGATATARFRDASYNLGMLAHFYGDILQPFHTSRDAIGQETTHLAYELLVDKSNRHPTDAPTWSVANTAWVVSDVTNMRSAALAAAAYSRARYLTLAANFKATDTTLSPTAGTVTKEVLIRASGDLANLVASVPKGIGNPPAAGKLTITLRYRGVKANEASERLDGTVLDVNGKPIEGVRVNVVWPMPDGTTKTLPFWTDELGKGHVYGTVGSNPLMVHQAVTATVTTNLTTLIKGTWWYRTPKLADGTAGFVTTVNDRTVRAGQTVTVTTTAKSTTGSPVVGLLVTWTWKLGSTTVTTSAYTDSTGKARSSRLITSSTTRSTIYVTARTSAYSLSRSSSTYFYRVD
jgi:hypothetical protein